MLLDRNTFLKLKKAGYAEMRAFCAGAVNQAIKAITTAKGFLSPSGIDIVCIPSFGKTEFGTDEKTTIDLTVRRER